jgi:hypothetical protein
MPWALLNHSFFCVNRIFIPHGNSPFPSNFCLFVLPSGENVKIKCVGGRGEGRIPFIPIQNLPLHSLNFGLPFFISGQISPKFPTTKFHPPLCLNGQRQKRLFGQFPPPPPKCPQKNVVPTIWIWTFSWTSSSFLALCRLHFPFISRQLPKKTNHCPAAIGTVAAAIFFVLVATNDLHAFCPFFHPNQMPQRRN